MEQKDWKREFENEVKKALASNHFEFPDGCSNLKKAASRILEQHPAMAMKCDTATYEKIVDAAMNEFADGLDMYSLSFFLNVVGLTKPVDLLMKMPIYLQLIKETEKVTKAFNAIASPMTTKIQKAIQTRMTLSAPKNGKFVNPNLRVRR